MILAFGDVPSLVACGIAAHRPVARDGGGATLLIPSVLSDAEQSSIQLTASLLDLDTAPLSLAEDLDDTLLLYHAARHAAAAGAEQLVWPAHPAPDPSRPGAIDRIASAIDRATLVSRLVNLDAWSSPAPGSPEIQIDAPLADLSDVQVADLVADMELPIDACWFWADPSPEAADLRARWGPALIDAGYTTLPAPHTAS